MTAKQTSAAIAAVLVTCVTSASVGASETRPVYARYQPTIDITKDPGCGKPLKTAQERIEHSRKLAELWFQNYQEVPKRKRNYNWWTYNCMAPGATFLFGTIDPNGEPIVWPSNRKEDPAALSNEQ